MTTWTQSIMGWVGAAPIFGMLVLVRLGAPAAAVEAPQVQDLVITVHDVGWSFGIDRASAPGEVGPRAAFVPAQLSVDPSSLRRVARDLVERPARVTVTAGEGVRAGDLQWTARALARLGPVSVDPGPVASISPSGHPIQR